MSGVRIWASRETKKITRLLIDGKDVVETKKYRIALPEFIARGGDKYPVLPFNKFGYVDADILKDFILKVKVLRAAEFAPTNYITVE